MSPVTSKSATAIWPSTSAWAFLVLLPWCWLLGKKQARTVVLEDVASWVLAPKILVFFFLTERKVCCLVGWDCCSEILLEAGWMLASKILF
jgi:hypothetical protein